MNKRRSILYFLPGAALLGAGAASLLRHAQAAVQKLDPREPQAVSLGYTDDTKTVDQKKYPKHTAAQTCARCQFYQTAQEANGIAPCTIFGGKGVAAKGWCSAFVVKPS